VSSGPRNEPENIPFGNKASVIVLHTLLKSCEGQKNRLADIGTGQVTKRTKQIRQVDGDMTKRDYSIS